jgi:uncharacterized membrane protein YebE (DUF533 family)
LPDVTKVQTAAGRVARHSSGDVPNAQDCPGGEGASITMMIGTKDAEGFFGGDLDKAYAPVGPSNTAK